MNIILSFPAQICKLLQSHTIMTLKQMRYELNGRARSSLFRDLKKIDVVTSYTHAGQYHALKSATKFNTSGLWFFEEVGFSQYGTLRNTLVQILSDAEIGMTHKELEKLLRIKVHDTLLDLVKLNAVRRHWLPNKIHVYLSADELKAKDQLQRRLTINERASDMTLPPECIRIEILVEVIRTASRTFDEKQLGAQLRQRGIVIKDQEVAYVLTYYDIKKKQILN